jgi:hypothetical protein
METKVALPKAVKVSKGKEFTLPGIYCGGKDGWTTTKALEAGVLIILSPIERSNGAVFINDTALGSLGYIRSSRKSVKPKCVNTKCNKPKCKKLKK